MAKLASYVYVDSEVYGPNDDVPADIARRITNPDAWEGGKVPASAPAPAQAPVPEPEPDLEPAGDGPARTSAPPRSGKGSGVDAWAAFAATQGVEVGADPTRDDVIAACEQAGVIADDGK